MYRVLLLLLLFGVGCNRSQNVVSNEIHIPPEPEPDISDIFRVNPKTKRTSELYRDYNIVFVSFDALQAAHVGCLGNPRKVTPTIDFVASNGVLFSKVSSVASWTVPASMTWFTGVYPSEHKLTNKYTRFIREEQKIADLRLLSPDLITLADALKQQGYVTGGFTGNAGVSGSFGYEQGFDVYYHEKNTFGTFDQSVPKALEWLKANKDKKFFLFLHGYDMHGQHAPAKGFDYRYVDPNYDKRYTGSEHEQEEIREEGLEHGKVPLRESDLLFWRAVYDEKIERADRKFKRFLHEFAKLGVMDKTIFILTSDHGTEFGEHGRFDHGFTLYQEQIHVPLVIRFPDSSTSRTIPERVSSIDIMPTILNLLEVTPSEKLKGQLRGKSLWPILNGAKADRDLYSETDYREFTFKRAITTPNGWKLIYTLEDKSVELFNLNEDPFEKSNVVAKNPELARELEGKIFRHFESIGYDLTKRRWEKGINPVYPIQGKPILEPKK